MKTAIYLRTSTDRQFVDNQRPSVLQLAEARSLEIVKVYEEQASSVKHRPEWERLKNDAHRGEFRCLVLHALDRLGRSMIGNVQQILELDRMGIEVVSVREPWLDTRGPVRTLLIAILSWVAEEERRQIASRSKLGVERARRAGKVIGRPRVEVDLHRALELRAEGMSVKDVARAMGVPRSTLYRELSTVQKVPSTSKSCSVPIPGEIRASSSVAREV
jgi:putative DNA-invertase from lambdoid prophage Rac